MAKSGRITTQVYTPFFNIFRGQGVRSGFLDKQFLTQFEQKQCITSSRELLDMDSQIGPVFSSDIEQAADLSEWVEEPDWANHISH